MSADCCCHFTWLPLMLLLVVVVAAFHPAAKVEEVSSAVAEQILSFDFAWQNSKQSLPHILKSWCWFVVVALSLVVCIVVGLSPIFTSKYRFRVSISYRIPGSPALPPPVINHICMRIGFHSLCTQKHPQNAVTTRNNGPFSCGFYSDSFAEIRCRTDAFAWATLLWVTVLHMAHCLIWLIQLVTPLWGISSG